MPSLFILVPLLLIVILNLPMKRLRGNIALFTALVLCIVQSLLSLIYLLFKSVHFDPVVPFFTFALSIDRLTLILLCTIGIVSFASLLVAHSTIVNPRQKFIFINLLLIALIGMNTIVLVTDLFSLYVFIEITAVASFVLIAIDKDLHAIEGTFKYLMLSSVATVFMLSSIAFFILVAGGTSFSDVHNSFSGTSDNPFTKIAAGLFLCGLLIKSGLVPFHGWLPDAYSAAPGPVSVLLAGIVTKITGIYTLLRLSTSVFVLNESMQNMLMFIGALSIVLAALAAVTQSDFKRMLAYSSISQVGYIALALGCATPLALAGAVFHFFNHAIAKSLLFVNAASLEKRFATTDMNKLRSFGAKPLVTSVTSLIGFLSAAGMPPLAGFWSKLIIVIALFSAGKTIYASVALLATILTLTYFLSLQTKVFFCKAQTVQPTVSSLPAIAVAEIILAAIAVLIGVCFPFVAYIWFLPLKEILH